MQTEIEAKWLDVNLLEMRNRLSKVGAKLETKERLMARKVYDYPDKRLGFLNGWVRVRDEGNKITISYKQLDNRTVSGTKEATVVVNDFEAACSFLELIGMEVNSFQETKRESWTLNGTEIELDTWPWIPSFIEIEAKSERELKDTAQILGLNYERAQHGSVETAYQAIYDVTEEEVDGWQEIRFTQIPEWLAQKAKNSSN